jgi:hypothetical protein
MKRTGNCDRLPCRTRSVKSMRGRKPVNIAGRGYLMNRRGFLRLIGATSAAALTASCGGDFIESG